jgi:uncharacterized membrane-anchored protein
MVRRYFAARTVDILSAFSIPFYGYCPSWLVEKSKRNLALNKPDSVCFTDQAHPPLDTGVIFLYKEVGKEQETYMKIIFDQNNPTNIE